MDTGYIKSIEQLKEQQKLRLKSQWSQTIIWHDLTIDPTNLPTKSGYYWVISVCKGDTEPYDDFDYTDSDCVKYYDTLREKWDHHEFEDVLAWCNIPKVYSMNREMDK